jgi:hypothetical protein
VRRRRAQAAQVQGALWQGGRETQEPRAMPLEQASGTLHRSSDRSGVCARGR